MGEREYIIEQVRNDGFSLRSAPEALRGDREVVLAAVNNDGVSIRFASEALRGDREVVLAAVNNDGLALQSASEVLQGDREIVLAAVNNKGIALRSAHAALRGDREIVLAAVNNDGMAIRSVSEVLRGDREVILAAVNNNGEALLYLPENIRSDREVMITAVTNRGDTLRFASKDLQDDKEFILAVVKNNVTTFEFASKRLKSDEEVVKVVALDNVIFLQFASNDLLDDEDFIGQIMGSPGFNQSEAIKRFVGPRLKGEIKRDPNYLLSLIPTAPKPAERFIESPPLQAQQATVLHLQGFVLPFTYTSKINMDGKSSVLWELLDWGFNMGVDEVHKQNKLNATKVFVSPWSLKFSQSPPAVDTGERVVDYQTVIEMNGTSNYLWNLIDFGYENGVNEVFKHYNTNRVGGYVSPWKSRFAASPLH